MAQPSTVESIATAERGVWWVLWAPEAPPPDPPAALADWTRLDLSAALIAELGESQARSLAAEEAAALARRAETAGGLLIETARANTRAALASAYDSLLARLAPAAALVVSNLPLALAEGLDLARLAAGRERLVWWAPGRLTEDGPRLYGTVPAPTAIAAGQLVEWADAAR